MALDDSEPELAVSQPLHEAGRDRSNAATPRRPQGRRGSQFALDYGRRQLKAYPITDGEMEGLAALGLLATLAFSAAAGFLGFAIDLQKDLAITTDIPERAAVFWGTLRSVAFVAAAMLASAGGFLVWRGHTKLEKIKKGTTFNAG